MTPFLSDFLPRSEATKQSILSFEAGLLRFARNDGVLAAFPVFALRLLAGI
jgi:hypothetical protein